MFCPIVAKKSESEVSSIVLFIYAMFAGQKKLFYKKKIDTFVFLEELSIIESNDIFYLFFHWGLYH